MKSLKTWMLEMFSLADDPVRHCNVYKTVGCAHVDGPLCHMQTCDIAVDAQITPRLIYPIERKIK